MTTTETSEAFSAIALEKIYTEIRGGIRETDNISFKLLGLVPLVSGTALIGLIVQTRNLPTSLVILLSLFASSVTLGLFRWELRNVQTCSWLIQYADAIEAYVLSARGAGAIFCPRPKPPQHIGKVEAQKLIYSTTIIAWLALPISVQHDQHLPDNSLYYLVGATLVLLGTIASWFAKPRVAPLSAVGER